AGSLLEEGYSDVPDVDSFLDRAERQIFDITQEGVARDYASMSEVLETAFEQLEALYETDEQITGVPSGSIDLDEITAGWQDSDLIIV
ncbi:MAG: replicative DNA helicase, partial [Bradymonadaceae bacterium]